MTLSPSVQHQRQTSAFQKYDNLFPRHAMNPDMQNDPVDWLLPGFIMRSKINVIVGPEKAGKSRFLSWLLIHMLSSYDTLGQTGKSPGRVLYLLGEETQAQLVDRFRLYAKLINLDFNSIRWAEGFDLIDAAGMRLDQRQQRDWLGGKLSEYSTLIIDPLRRVHGGSESSNDEMSLIFNDLRNWSNQLSLTVILLHHTGKLSPDDDEDRIATWCRGATDLPAVLDWAVYMKRRRSGSDCIADEIMIKRQGRAVPLEDVTIFDHRDQIPGFSLTSNPLIPEISPLTLVDGGQE